MIPIPSPMLMAAGGLAALVAAFCVAGVIEMTGVESAAAAGCDSPVRAVSPKRVRP